MPPRGLPANANLEQLGDAALRGHRECAEMLLAAGATSGADPLYAFMEASTEGDRDRVRGLLAGDPTLADQAITKYPDQLVRAAQGNSLDGVALLIDLGFDVNAPNRLERFHESAPLHEAAAQGNVEMIELLLAHGADPNLRDGSYDATPAGWAEHFGQKEAERYLTALAPEARTVTARATASEHRLDTLGVR